MSTREPVEYIDLTPTWEQAANVYMAALEDGSPRGRRAARDELLRMGRLLDQVAPQGVTRMPAPPPVCPQCGGDPRVDILPMNQAFRFMAPQTVVTRCCGAELALVPTFAVTLKEKANGPDSRKV